VFSVPLVVSGFEEKANSGSASAAARAKGGSNGFKAR
jgi:hypothetical protein